MAWYGRPLDNGHFDGSTAMYEFNCGDSSYRANDGPPPLERKIDQLMSTVRDQKGMLTKSLADYAEFQKQVSTQVDQLSKKVEALQSQSSGSCSSKVPVRKNIPNDLSVSYSLYNLD